MKSDFILSLCDLIIGGKEGLSPLKRRSLTAAPGLCTGNICRTRAPENMPILGDLTSYFFETVEPEAQNIATALEIYVNGSLNVFNHRSNIQMDQPPGTVFPA